MDFSLQFLKSLLGTNFKKKSIFQESVHQR